MHIKKYISSESIRTDKSIKYLDYISHLFPRAVSPTKKTASKSGSSLPNLMISNTNFEREYIYWDDPNEIVDRLRQLMASQAAGNTSHNNEIISIIEELREAKIIY